MLLRGQNGVTVVASLPTSPSRDVTANIPIPHVNFQQSDWSIGRVTILIIIPHVNFQQSDWSIGRVTILNVTRQCLTVAKFVVEMGHSV